MLPRPFICEVPVEQPESSDLLQLPLQYIYILAPIKSSQCAVPAYFSFELGCRTIISTDILCANAVIDTFITSKGIQFSFQSGAV